MSMRAVRSARRTLYEHAVELAAIMPTENAFLGESCAASYRAVLDDSRALASSLWSRGLRTGDRIGFQLPNWLEAAVINLAACQLGLICVPIQPVYRDAELAFMLEDSQCRAVFIPDRFRSFDFTSMYRRLLNGLVRPPLLVSVRGAAVMDVRYDDLLVAGQSQPIDLPPVETSAPKLLLYTSGTTGRAKAVLHSHETLSRAVHVSVAHWGIQPGDAVLMPSPVTHATGYANALELPFLHATRTVLMDRWDADQAVALIEQYRVAATVGATPFLKELTTAARETGSRLPSLRVFACGGAAVPPAVIEAANQQFLNRPAFRVYGSSEAPYVALGRPPKVDEHEAATSDGEVLDYSIRVVDELGADVVEGAEGEILVKGPALFLGYARAADNDDCYSSDGFFRTGDIGVYGPGRWLSITGRKKDLIIRGGENISAKEIEDLLHAHPQIAEASVVAMPDTRLGEGVFAFVIAREAEIPSLENICSFLQSQRLARHKFPDRLAIVADFPRTASGKIRKEALRRRAAEIIGQT